MKEKDYKGPLIYISSQNKRNYIGHKQNDPFCVFQVSNLETYKKGHRFYKQSDVG